MLRLFLGAVITAMFLVLTIMFAFTPNVDLRWLVGSGFLLLFTQREVHRDIDKWLIS